MATRKTRANSEMEALRAKIRKVEETLLDKDKELISKEKELQLIKNYQADHEGHEVVDNILVFMNNQGLKHIANKILSFLDRLSFANCRLLSRSWRNYIDDEVTLLHLQISHFKQFKPYLSEEGDYYSLMLDILYLGPLFETMEKSKDKSDLKVFVNMCRQLESRRYRNFEESPFEYLIDHHRHEELRLLLDSPVKMTSTIVKRQNWRIEGYARRNSLNVPYPYHPYKEDKDLPSIIFKYACYYGCVKCVKLFLDRSEAKKIDVNYKSKHILPHFSRFEDYFYDHCLTLLDPIRCPNYYPHKNTEVHESNNILMLLLSRAEEKGIDINGTDRFGETIKVIMEKYASWHSKYVSEDVLNALGIDQSKYPKPESESE